MKIYSVLFIILSISVILVTGCSSNSESNQAATSNQAANAKASNDGAAPQASEALQKAVDQYRDYVVEQCDQLVIETEEFVNQVKAGNVDKAKQLYAPARMYYERIEPIAESFGDLDPDVDARENDVDESEWGGFHRIEKSLWENNSTEGMNDYADELLDNVKLLRAKVETVEIEPSMLVVGAVELLNEVSSSKVTGEEERYSHTDLYDFVANVQGAEKIFELLKAELGKQDAALTQTIDERLTALNQDLALYQEGDGYVLYTNLKADQTKGLSQKVDALAEPLSKMGKAIGV